MKARQFGHIRRLSTAPFYNPSVRRLLQLLMLTVASLVPARAERPLPPGTPTAYTLPPDKLAQAKAFAFTENVLYFASTAATLALVALLVRLRTGAAVRARMEK